MNTQARLDKIERSLAAPKNGTRMSELETWAYENRVWLTPEYCPAPWLRFIADFKNEWIKSGFYRQLFRQCLAEDLANSPDPERRRDAAVYRAAHVYYCERFQLDPADLDLLAQQEGIDRLQVEVLFRAMPAEVLASWDD